MSRKCEDDKNTKAPPFIYTQTTSIPVLPLRDCPDPFDRPSKPVTILLPWTSLIARGASLQHFHQLLTRKPVFFHFRGLKDDHRVQSHRACHWDDKTKSGYRFLSISPQHPLSISPQNSLSISPQIPTKCLAVYHAVVFLTRITFLMCATD